jgi:hypothetical protein
MTQHTDPSGTDQDGDRILELLRRIVEAGGRMRKHEVHELARDLGLAEQALRRLWTDEPRVLEPHDDDHVVTDVGRRRLNNTR